MLLILVLKRDDTHDRTVLVGCFVWHYMFFLIWTWMQNLGKFILLYMCNCYETNIFISMNIHVYTFYQCNLYKNKFGFVYMWFELNFCSWLFNFEQDVLYSRHNIYPIFCLILPISSSFFLIYFSIMVYRCVI